MLMLVMQRMDTISCQRLEKIYITSHILQSNIYTHDHTLKVLNKMLMCDYNDVSAAGIHTNCRFSPAGWMDGEGVRSWPLWIGTKLCCSLPVVSSRQSFRIFPAQLGTSVTQIKSNSHIREIIQSSGTEKLVLQGDVRVPSRASCRSAASCPASSCSCPCDCALAAAAQPAPSVCWPTRCAVGSTSYTCRT